MVEEPAKPRPCIFSHPGINSQAGLCSQCYIYREQPYGIGIFLLTSSLPPSKQQREGLLQNSYSCISISLRIPSQVQRQHLPQCSPSAPLSSQGPAGGTSCFGRNAPDTEPSSCPWVGMVWVWLHHLPLGTMRCKQCTHVSLHSSEGSLWVQGVFIGLPIM